MLYGSDNELTEAIIGCAIEVHKQLGPGLLESVYEAALCVGLEARGISFDRQVGVPLYYKGRLLSEHRPDLVVEERGVVEVKCVQHIEPVHVAQVMTC
jgi:GxxExxY protein